MIILQIQTHGVRLILEPMELVRILRGTGVLCLMENTCILYHTRMEKEDMVRFCAMTQRQTSSHQTHGLRLIQVQAV